MPKEVSEKVDKFNIISTTCATYNDIVITIPAFKATVDYMNAENAAIKILMAALELDDSGTAAAKKAAKIAAAKLIDPLCGAMMSYADKVQNLQLLAAANYTESTIVKIRDEDMVQTCTALIALADQHILALADYGYTKLELDEATAAVAAFDVLNPKPIADRSDNKADLATLIERTKALNTFVGKQMKNAAKRFKITHPEFYEKLMNSMRSQNKGIRHKVTEEEKALRKAKREQKAAEKAAAKATAKAAQEAEALAKTAALQKQLDEAVNNTVVSEPINPVNPVGSGNGTAV